MEHVDATLVHDETSAHNVERRRHLVQIARWARILAITGMAVLGLGLVAALMGSTVYTTFGIRIGNQQFGAAAAPAAARVGAVITAIVTAVVFLFPLLLLLRFSGCVRKALRSGDEEPLHSAFRNLTFYLRYLSVVAIVLLVLLVAFILIGFLGAAAVSKGA